MLCYAQDAAKYSRAMVKQWSLEHGFTKKNNRKTAVEYKNAFCVNRPKGYSICLSMPSVARVKVVCLKIWSFFINVKQYLIVLSHCTTAVAEGACSAVGEQQRGWKESECHHM